MGDVLVGLMIDVAVLPELGMTTVGLLIALVAGEVCGDPGECEGDKEDPEGPPEEYRGEGDTEPIAEVAVSSVVW